MNQMSQISKIIQESKKNFYKIGKLTNKPLNIKNIT